MGRSDRGAEALGFLQAGFDFAVWDGFLADDGEESFLVLQILKGKEEFFILPDIEDNSFLPPFFICYILCMSFHE